MKILHLPTPVGGNSWGLAQGEKALGLESEVMVTTQGPFRYPADIDLGLTSDMPRAKRFARSFAAFFQVRKKYDIFHFNYGTSLVHWEKVGALHLWDLPYYPKKARLFVTYNGCDARQKFPTMQRTPIAACHNKKCYGGMCNSGRKDEVRRRCIEKMSRYVEHMWALNPDLLYFLPKEKASFLPYTVSHHDVTRAVPDLTKKKLTIVHSPTSREAKGSGHVLAALNKLQKKYPDAIEVVLVEGLPHAEAMARYRAADLVIDQVLIGWYGAFAVEVMLMGKPVMARVAEQDLHFIPKAMAEDLRKGIINVDPITLYDTLERCLQDRTFLKEKGEAGEAYARRWHDPKYVASLTQERYACVASAR